MMKKIRGVIIAGVISLALLPQGASANKKDEAVGIVKQFAGSLKGELQAAMKSGGPTKAIQVCSEKAPSIAADLSRKSGGLVRRVSLKVRNPSDIPDAWEREVLEEFDRQAKAGADLTKLAKGEMVTEGGQKYFRLMKAIPTAKLCLTCHGTEINAAVKKELDDKYPHDVARGYTEGMVRGAFTVKLPVN